LQLPIDVVLYNERVGLSGVGSGDEVWWGRAELGIAHSSARRGLDALRIPMVVLTIARFIDKIEI